MLLWVIVFGGAACEIVQHYFYFTCGQYTVLFFYLYDLCWFIFSTRATKHAIISKNTFPEDLHIHHKPLLIGLKFHQHFYQSSNKTWCLSAAPDSCHSFFRQPYTTDTCYFLCCTWRKSYFVQSQNTTKHKTKFITILQQHVSA